MAVYESAQTYIESSRSLRDKINRIDAVIDGLLSNALKAAATDHISEYQLNDGQTVIKTVYRGAEGVMHAIQSFERIKQLYINALNGRAFRLSDHKNFR